MLDDGMHMDGDAGDGVYGVRLDRFEHNTQVRFRIQAAEGERTAVSPRLQDATAPLPEEVWGYYVNDLRPDTELPLYHILLYDENGAPINASDFRVVNEHLECLSQVLKPGSFVFRGELYPDVGVRWRGNAMCGVDKRNFKSRLSRKVLAFDDGKIFIYKGKKSEQLMDAVAKQRPTAIILNRVTFDEAWDLSLRAA